MFQIIKKADQFNDIIFNGRFHVNKPVFNQCSTVKPYSNLLYWSNAYAKDQCEFDLHPHKGFEIMTFILEGSIAHFDSDSQVWSSLHAGDFQIIQSNMGIEHQESIAKDSRFFQIWFDPNIKKAFQLKPSYDYYKATNFLPIVSQGYKTITYLGEGSAAQVLTPNIIIKKLIFDSQWDNVLSINKLMSYTFYVLSGSGKVNGQLVETDDAIRISNCTEISVDFKGELFYIETPTTLSYKPFW